VYFGVNNNYNSAELLLNIFLTFELIFRLSVLNFKNEDENYFIFCNFYIISYKDLWFSCKYFFLVKGKIL
jgi:hypothetical protein